MQTMLENEKLQRPKLSQNITEVIGYTPLVKLNSVSKTCQANIYAKLEYLNPGGSVKDRISINMVLDAERKGLIHPGKTTLIEATSGNTGIGLAMVAAVKGYKFKCVMPSIVSQERKLLVKALGAEVILGDMRLKFQGFFDLIDYIVANTENSYLISQFSIPSNPETHMLTTGPEIWNDTDGKVDCVVAGVGTGGTITGLGRYFNEIKHKKVDMVVVEPQESAVLSGGEPGPHEIQGIGAGMVPDNYDGKYTTHVIPCSSKNAFTMAKRLAKEEGMLTGISAGAAVYSAIEYASKEENKDKTVVVIIPSQGERYLSTNLYKDILEEVNDLKLTYTPQQEIDIKIIEQKQEEQKQLQQKQLQQDQQQQQQQ